MTTAMDGDSSSFNARPLMRSTIDMPSITSPNTTYCPFSSAKVSTVMKNSEPFWSGPILAIATSPLCILVLQQFKRVSSITLFPKTQQLVKKKQESSSTKQAWCLTQICTTNCNKIGREETTTQRHYLTGLRIERSTEYSIVMCSMSRHAW